VALVTDWRKEFDLPADMLKGGLLCSGIYDLKPVRLSAQLLRQTTDDRTRAQHPAPPRQAQLVRWIGRARTWRRPSLSAKTRDFAAAVKASGKPVHSSPAQGYNHFEIFETLASPYGLLGRAALERLKSAGITGIHRTP